MRLAIITAALIIGKSINPEHDYHPLTGLLLIFFGAWDYIVDLKNKLK